MRNLKYLFISTESVGFVIPCCRICSKNSKKMHIYININNLENAVHICTICYTVHVEGYKYRFALYCTKSLWSRDSTIQPRHHLGNYLPLPINILCQLQYIPPYKDFHIQTFSFPDSLSSFLFICLFFSFFFPLISSLITKAQNLTKNLPKEKTLLW